MQTQKVNINGIILWVTILHPMLDDEGKINPSNKFLIYQSYYEPVNNYYGELVWSYGDYPNPITCDNMNEAINVVEGQISKRFVKNLNK